MARAVIIDTDPGVDDVLAILYAMLSGEVDVRAILTVNGNTSLHNATQNLFNCLRVMHHHHRLRGDKSMLARPVVAMGAAQPLHVMRDKSNNARADNAEYAHGANGLGGMTEVDVARILGAFKLPAEMVINDCDMYVQSECKDASDELLRQVREAPPRTITLVMLGPLTNLALALERDTEHLLATRLDRVYIMGGCLHHPTPGGNITPSAEFNFYADPMAADAVLSAGLPVTLVPLDVTENCRLRYAAYHHNVLPIAQHSPLPAFVAGFIQQIWEFMDEREYAGAPPLTDDGVAHPTAHDLATEVRVENDRMTPPRLVDIIESERTAESRIAWHTSLGMHDPLCMGVMLDPAIVLKTITVPVRVETTIGALTRGACVVDGRRWRLKCDDDHQDPTVTSPAIDVVMRVDNAAFFTRFMHTLFDVEWDDARHAWVEHRQ